METSQISREIILQTPALQPPQGVTPNFVNPPNNKNLANAIALVSLLISTFAFTVRMYTKAFVFRKLMIEDYLLAFSWLLYAAGFYTIGFMLANLPSGVHQWEVTIGYFIRQAHLHYIGGFLYYAVIISLRSSIVLQCIRFFVPNGVRNAVFWTFHVLLWIHLIGYTIMIIIMVAALRNSKVKIWNPTTVDGYCRKTGEAEVVIGVINPTSDLLLVLIPLIVIWRLKTKTIRKWKASSVFAFGLLACAASCMRLYYIIRSQLSADCTYFTSLKELWTAPELAFGFLVACLPAFPKFLKRVISTRIMSNLGMSARSFLQRQHGLPTSEDGRQNQSPGRFEALNDEKSSTKKATVSDAEFEELVLRTDGSGALNLEQPTRAHGQTTIESV